MPNPNLIQNPDGSPLLSLEQAVSNANAALVQTETQGFTSHFHLALKANTDLIKLEREVEEIVQRGHKYLAQTIGVLIEGGMDRTEAEQTIYGELKAQEETLVTRDFSSLARFYRDKAEALKQQGEATPGGKTKVEVQGIAYARLQADPIAKHMVAKFKDDVDVLLHEGETAALTFDQLQTKVIESLKIDRDIDPDQKNLLLNRVEPVIRTLRSLSMLRNVKTIPLSAKGVYGMIGRVLDDADMMKVFSNDVAPIRALPTGSVEVKFADETFSFYHNNGEDLDARVLAKINSTNPPYHILFVHYRTDEDVRDLIDDMGEGNYLVAKMRGTDEEIKIEGASTLKLPGEEPKCKVISTGIPEADLIKNPMKYMDHDITFN